MRIFIPKGFALGVVMGLALAGCGPEILGGGVGATHSLDGSVPRGYWLGQELVISFERGASFPSIHRAGPHVRHQLARVSLHSGRRVLDVGHDILLAGEGVVPFAQIEHYVLRREGRHGLVQTAHFPQLSGGRIHFTALGPEEGDRVAGYFEATFSTGADIWGEFDLVLERP